MKLSPEKRARMTAQRRQARLDTQDPDVPKTGAEKRARMDLGLALLSRVALPGVRYTIEEIAAWAGCTDGAIYLIEQTALKKLRKLAWRDAGLRETAGRNQR